YPRPFELSVSTWRERPALQCVDLRARTCCQCGASRAVSAWRIGAHSACLRGSEQQFREVVWISESFPFEAFRCHRRSRIVSYRRWYCLGNVSIDTRAPTRPRNPGRPDALGGHVGGCSVRLSVL